jgi:hypothetical protein
MDAIKEAIIFFALGLLILIAVPVVLVASFKQSWTEAGDQVKRDAAMKSAEVPSPGLYRVVIEDGGGTLGEVTATRAEVTEDTTTLYFEPTSSKSTRTDCATDQQPTIIQYDYTIVSNIGSGCIGTTNSAIFPVTKGLSLPFTVSFGGEISDVYYSLEPV